MRYVCVDYDDNELYMITIRFANAIEFQFQISNATWKKFKPFIKTKLFILCLRRSLCVCACVSAFFEA